LSTKALLTAALTVGLTALAHAGPSGPAVSPAASPEQAGSPNQPPLGGPTFATSSASPASLASPAPTQHYYHYHRYHYAYHYHRYHYAYHHMHQRTVALIRHRPA
jgi:hypothetical protein